MKEQNHALLNLFIFRYNQIISKKTRTDNINIYKLKQTDNKYTNLKKCNGNVSKIDKVEKAWKK